MTSFVAATVIKPASPHAYNAVFPSEWCIGVAKAHFASTLKKQNQPHTIALHLEFVRRTQVGPAVFTVKDVKLGRQTSTIHISLAQDNREEVVAYITHTNLSTERGQSYETGWALHPVPPPVASLSAMAAGNDATWQERTSMPFSEFRKASNKVRFFFPQQGQQMRSLTNQWMCMRTGERFTDAMLGFVADMFPMIPEIYRSDTDPYSIRAEREGADTEAEARKKGSAKFWYPTLLLNLDVKKSLPEEGVEWLFVRTRAKLIRNGRYDLEVIIMDEGGEVVALSHHVCMVLDASRNLARRKPGNKL